MNAKTRIWRATPVQGTVKAPSFFVESTENGLEDAKEEALKIASTRTRLSHFESWNIDVEKCRMRKDEYGRYWKYHQ